MQQRDWCGRASGTEGSMQTNGLQEEIVSMNSIVGRPVCEGLQSM